MHTNARVKRIRAVKKFMIIIMVVEDSGSETRAPVVYSTENFKEAVQEFLRINDRLTEIRRDTSVLNKRKKKLSELIINFMKAQDKEFCNLGEKGSLQLKSSKTTQALKKDQVAKLLLQFGDSEERSTEVANFLFSNKVVKERSVIKLSSRPIE